MKYAGSLTIMTSKIIVGLGTYVAGFRSGADAGPDANGRYLKMFVTLANAPVAVTIVVSVTSIVHCIGTTGICKIIGMLTSTGKPHTTINQVPASSKNLAALAISISFFSLL